MLFVLEHEVSTPETPRWVSDFQSRCQIMSDTDLNNLKAVLPVVNVTEAQLDAIPDVTVRA